MKNIIKQKRKIGKILFAVYIILLLTTMLSLGIIAHAVDTISSEVQSASSGTTDATAQADQAGAQLINQVRKYTIIGLVVLIVILGVAIGFGGVNTQKMAGYKVWAIVIILACFLIFKTAWVLKTIFKIIGVDTATYGF